MKGIKNGITALFIGGTILLLFGCVSPQNRDLTLTRKTGVRVAEINFDTTFTRDEYVILGTVTGEGTVTLRQIGKEPKDRSLFSFTVPDSYLVMDHDPSLGTWIDEDRIYIEEIANKRIPPQEAEAIRTMETIAARIALSNALESMPEADAILAPRFEFTYQMEEKVLGREYVATTEIIAVKAMIRGKGIRLKTDEELQDDSLNSFGTDQERDDHGVQLSFRPESEE